MTKIIMNFKSVAVFDKLIITYLVNRFPPFCGTQLFIHSILHPNTLLLRSGLTSFRLHPGLTYRLYTLRVFCLKILFQFFISCMLIACYNHLILLHSITCNTGEYLQLELWSFILSYVIFPYPFLSFTGPNSPVNTFLWMTPLRWS
jgi:hypothetical protein